MSMPCAIPFAVVTGLFLLSQPSALAQDVSQAEEGFTRLDNGKDLEGWTGDTTGWGVRDGAIHLDARRAKGHIYSKATHSGDCIIRLQFRATPGADSGVYIHGRQLQVRDYPNAGPQQYAGAAR